ncbi:MAG TPA: protein kinase [Planctomycetota bacterium]
MSLAPGSKLMHYDVLAPLGAGAMGEVWRARDSRLGREVAIKVLPEHFAEDEERLQRFEREAKALASLNHPNVAQIHGIDQVGDTCFLVLELVPGETLEERLARGPLPRSEALDVARQIAEALEAAHAAGVIHRDLKPANVRLTPEGRVKVLDFGLAKSVSESGAGSSTDSVFATAAGRLLGTPTYMAPEQARGKAIDKRVDIWAFGCVLYECLTAKRAFVGESLGDVLGAVLHTTPDLGGLPADTPAALRMLVARCLEKERAQRLGDFAVVRFLLEEASAPGSSVAHAAAPAARGLGGARLALLVLGAMLVAAAAMRFLGPRAPAPARQTLARTSLVLPEGDELTNADMQPLALSPDGTLVCYVGGQDGKARLFLRALAEPEARALDGTEGAEGPFFSPDGQWIAFFAQRKLKKVAISGAGLQVVSSEVPDPRGGAWGEDERIYFAPSGATGLHAVPAAGGAATPVTAVDRSRGEISHRWPVCLPGGKQLLFLVWTGPGLDECHVTVLDLARGAQHRLLSGGSSPRFVHGHLVYARQDNLFAVPWNPQRTDVGGTAPTALVEHARNGGEGAAAYAVSPGGTMIFLQGGAERYRQRVVWVDREGRTETTRMPDRNYESVTLSPDGTRAVVQIDEGTVGLWLYDFARNTLTPFVTTGGSSQAPVWTPDGTHIAYRGTRNGQRSLHWKAVDGASDEERLALEDGVTQTPQSVSPDGRWLVFNQAGGATLGSGDIYLIPLTTDAGERKARPLVRTAAGERNGRISPDGRWLAYVSDVSGQEEVYVQPFPGPGASLQVSLDGGEEPLWSPDGRELFFVSSARLMVVELSATPASSAGSPRVLYEGRYRPSVNANTPFDIAPDGKRFLRVQQGQPEAALTRIEVVQGWSAQLEPAEHGE